MRPRALRITYLLESTDLWGGVKVVFEQAEGLSEAGHLVTILSKDTGPDWYPLKVPLLTVRGFSDDTIPESDIIVATYWTTVCEAYGTSRGHLVHLCQGYEGGNIEFQEIKAAIDRAYSCKIPRLAVSPHIQIFLRTEFGAETFYVGQMVDPLLFWPRPYEEYERSMPPFAILLVGPIEADVKNIATALRGVQIARDRGLAIALVRVSQFPLSEEERKVMEPDAYHCRIPYLSMGDMYRAAHLCLSLSKEAEGFGLPAVEAMACGVPTVLSTSPAYVELDAVRDYALFVEPIDPVLIADAIERISKDRTLRFRLRQRGLEVAALYKKETVVQRLLTAFYTILSDGERSSSD